MIEVHDKCDKLTVEVQEVKKEITVVKEEAKKNKQDYIDLLDKYEQEPRTPFKHQS